MSRAWLVVLGLAGCDFQGAGISGDAPIMPTATIGFTAAQTVVDETTGMFEIPVALSEPVASAVTVRFAFVNGSAERDADFTGVDGTLTLAPGETTAAIEAAIVMDDQSESDEAFSVTLADPVGAQLGTASHEVAISANPLPRVAFANAASMAGEASNSNIVVMLGEASTSTVTVDVVVSGTAGSPSDHGLANRTVTFAPGDTMETLAIAEVDDMLDEDDESVVATLQNPTNAIIGGVDMHTHTILDNDAPPLVRFATGATNATEAGGTLDITVELSTASGRDVGVAFATGGAAAAGSDYTIATTSPLMFPAGTTTRTISVALVDDMASEPAETLTLQLQNAMNATIGGPAQHTVNITDNDQACYGTGTYEVCIATAPSTDVALPPNLNTDSSGLCAAQQPTGWTANQPAACFVFGATITQTGTTSVSGSRPLVLVSDSTISIAGLLDLASHRGGQRGAGHASKSCGAFTPTTLPADGGGADGGAGGTFLSLGGNGGGGQGAGNGNGGMAAAVRPQPTRLLSGCDGQAGGSGSQPAANGAFGGGVVYVLARGAITITGTIDVSGAGAVGGGSSSGGSGGGSGGMIKIFGGSLAATGRLVANGGGGSGGGDSNSPGAPGNDPNPAMPTSSPTGGTGAGGNGGRGFAVGSAAGVGTTDSKGGGGGGGGGGYIESNRSLAGATTSAGLVTAP